MGASNVAAWHIWRMPSWQRTSKLKTFVSQQVKKPVNVVLCCSFMFFFGSRPVKWMRKDIWHLNKFKPGSWLHSGWLHAMPYTSKNQTHIYIVLYNKRYLHVTTTLGGLVSATGCNPLARRKVECCHDGLASPLQRASLCFCKELPLFVRS